MSSFSFLTNCTVTKDLTDPENKMWLIHAVSGMLPVNSIYTFFQSEEIFLAYPHRIRCGSSDISDYIAVDVHIDDITSLSGSYFEIERHLGIRNVSGSHINKSICKLDLILDD